MDKIDEIKLMLIRKSLVSMLAMSKQWLLLFTLNKRVKTKSQLPVEWRKTQAIIIQFDDGVSIVSELCTCILYRHTQNSVSLAYKTCENYLWNPLAGSYR